MPTDEDIHALRNRLAVALGYARLLAEQPLSSEQQAWVSAIIDACRDQDIERETDLRPFIAALTDETIAPQAVDMSSGTRSGICSSCGETIEAPATILASPKPMTLIEAQALLDTEREAVDAVHRQGGHLRIEIAAGTSSVTLWRGSTRAGHD